MLNMQEQAKLLKLAEQAILMWQIWEDDAIKSKSFDPMRTDMWNTVRTFEVKLNRLEKP